MVVSGLASDTSRLPPTRIFGRRRWQKITLLTVSSVGVQIVWSSEMSQVSPYLLSLGVTKSQMAMVLLAGPLSGIYGDKSQHPLGRRRPFIFYGSLCTILSFFVFGWAQELASLFPPSAQSNLAIWLAVVAFFAIDFSVNVVGAAGRCLVVDSLPSSEQPLANAYTSRFTGAASIISLLISYIDLPAIFNPAMSQLKHIIIFAVLTFGLTQLATCLAVQERRLSFSDTPQSKQRSGLVDAWIEIWRTWNSLEGTPIKSVFWVQLWSWIAWFPLLFYSTTWIGEIWKKSETDHHNKEEEATRVASFGLLTQSVLSFLASIVIPRWVSSLRKKRKSIESSLQDGGKPLAKLWLYSQLNFGFLLGLNKLFSQNYKSAISMVGLSGVCSSVNGWAPFALLAEMITTISTDPQNANNEYSLLPISNKSGDPHATRLVPLLEDKLERRPSSYEISEEEEELEQLDRNGLSLNDGHLKSAGTILGIHNTFIVIPQFIISLISSILLGSIEDDQSDGIGMIFWIGSLSSVISGYMCWKLIRKIESQS